MKRTGLFWHVHHSGMLMELSTDIQERIRHIKMYKPADEVATRLRLLKPVKGPLPPLIAKAHAAWEKSTKRVWRDPSFRLRAVRGVAALRLYNAIQRSSRLVEALHKKECPDCPWDGRTIFPKKGVK